MTVPSVTITELDGALGVLPPSAGRLLAIVGASTAGPLNTPATFARTKPLIAAYGSGPLVEAAAHAIERFQKPVAIVRTGTTVAGVVAAIDDDEVAGTSIITVGDDDPTDDYEIVLRIVAGGTVGTAGITYQTSLDGGRTYAALKALGTANTITIPDSGVSLALAAGTLLAGDIARTTTTSPGPNAAEVTAALEALRVSTIAWEVVLLASPVDASAFDAIELKIAGMHAAGKYRAWVGNTRIPSVGESEATYLASVSGAFAAKASTHGQLCAGACKMSSSVSGRIDRRPIAFTVGAFGAAVSEEVNIADVNLGNLVGISIRDANGNPDEHDESINPGLDDARFTVLRTHEGLQGVYVNRPTLFSPAGSDYQLLPHRRVLNLGNDALRLYMLRRLNSPILVSKATGFILESEALEIEAGALGVLRAALMAKPKASGVMFALSRTDNLLSSKLITGDMRIIPLSYPEGVSLNVGFINPALQVKAV